MNMAAHGASFLGDMTALTRAFLFVRVSRNGKTGPIPVTYSARATCPPRCALLNNGCYGEHGPTAISWRRADEGISLEDLCLLIRALPKQTLWRHNIVGDLPGKGDVIDGRLLQDLVRANLGRRGFTYTHKPITKGWNFEHIQAANRNGFTVNLSANNLDEADAMAEIGGAPVVTLLPIDAKPITRTPKGRKVIACPAEVSETTTCSNCEWCSWADRDFIVGFRAHGTGKKKVDLIARQAA